MDRTGVLVVRRRHALDVELQVRDRENVVGAAGRVERALRALHHDRKRGLVGLACHEEVLPFGGYSAAPVSVTGAAGTGSAGLALALTAGLSPRPMASASAIVLPAASASWRALKSIVAVGSRVGLVFVMSDVLSGSEGGAADAYDREVIAARGVEGAEALQRGAADAFSVVHRGRDVAFVEVLKPAAQRRVRPDRSEHVGDDFLSLAADDADVGAGFDVLEIDQQFVPGLALAEIVLETPRLGADDDAGDFLVGDSFIGAAVGDDADAAQIAIGLEQGLEGVDDLALCGVSHH
ncbi:hypothetical protein SPHV1_100080 [Novosphingobium sp. KN65.2]|nr:hypothetical protein SPHV1_100080 [Novosphingobium sp. KN65.2]